MLIRVNWVSHNTVDAKRSNLKFNIQLKKMLKNTCRIRHFILLESIENALEDKNSCNGFSMPSGMLLLFFMFLFIVSTNQKPCNQTVKILDSGSEVWQFTAFVLLSLTSNLHRDLTRTHLSVPWRCWRELRPISYFISCFHSFSRIRSITYSFRHSKSA
jgi:hypothetical protein